MIADFFLSGHVKPNPNDQGKPTENTLVDQYANLCPKFDPEVIVCTISVNRSNGRRLNKWHRGVS